MEKYNGNQKGFIYAAFDAKNREEVLSKYLEPLSKEGVSFWWADGFDKKEEDNITRSNAVLVFLTKDYAKDDKLRKTVEAAVRNDKPILTVYLEKVDLDAGLSMQLESQQALFRNKYESEEEFVDELKKAAIFDGIEVTEQQKKKQKSRSIMAIAAALVGLLVLAVIIKPLLTPNKVNAETMEALGLQGLSKTDLESIEMLHIVGNEVVTNDVHAFYYEGNRNNILYHSAGQLQDYYQYYTEPENEKSAVTGSISDLAGLEQLKNIRVLELEGQQIEDISPLLGLENLEVLSINCNPVSSLEGIENLSNLKRLDITGTEVTDLSPVFKLENLEQLRIDGTNVTDLSGIEDMNNLKILSMQDTRINEIPDGTGLTYIDASGSALRSVPDFGRRQDICFFTESAESLQDFSNLSTAGGFKELRVDKDASLWLDPLKGIPTFTLFTQDLDIDSMNDLDGLVLNGSLDLNDSLVRSLDGIDKFNLNSLLIKNCRNLTDLSPINGTEIRYVQISDDMHDLAEALDDSIAVSED